MPASGHSAPQSGSTLEDALARHEEVILFEGTPADYAAELIEECYDLPQALRSYIDHEALGRDMVLNGEIAEIRRGLTVTNASEL